MNKTIKKSNHKQFHPARWLIILIFVTAVIISCLAWYLHERADRHHAIEKQRTQFIQADAQLNELADKIVAKFGAPIARQNDDSCSYTSNPDEFEKGELSCVVGSSMLIQTENLMSAQSTTQHLSSFINNEEIEDTNLASSENQNVPTKLGISRLNPGLYSGLNCDVSYEYYYSGIASTFRLPVPPKAGNVLLISLSCTMPRAEAPYYMIVH